MTIRHWLETLGLDRYADAFEANDVDLAVAAELTAEDLRELGVASVGHRRKLLSAIAALPGEPSDSARPAIGFGETTEPRSKSAPAQRRQVTVLFADLVGYTQLSREVDSEELHGILQAFFNRVDGIVSAHGGSVNKHIGDCVMAVFGAPVAHDNDAERAALAALAIAEAMSDLSAGLGRRLEVHTGLASGQAVATELGSDLHRGFEVIGDAVNHASRLADRASAGEVLVSETVRRMLPARIQTEPCRTDPGDEVTPCTPVWRLVGRSEPASDAPPGRIFGRRSELHQLESTLANSRKAGRGQTVLVRGEAGIGKSRLVEELRRRAEAVGFRAHTGLVIDFGGGSGRDAIRTLVRSLLASASDAGENALEAAQVLGLPPERKPFLNDLLGLPQSNDARRIYEAMDNEARNAGKRETVVELVRLATRAVPRLVIIEDVHWADRIVLDHVAHLARTIRDVPAVLVVTTRREGDPLDESWRAEAGDRSMLTLDLGPLDPEDAARFARTFASRSPEFVERCLARAGGNPLFLEHLLRHGEEGAEADGVPGSIHSLVQARLDRLGEAEREAIQAASVLGQRFEQCALEALVGRGKADLSPLFAHLMLRRLEGGQILFAHALIRDAIYDTLMTSRRRALHRAAAAHFAESDLPLCAEHLDKAGDPAAPSAYLDAAAEEQREYRYRVARTLAERGLDLADTRKDRFELACLLGEICRDLGALADAKAAWERALAAAESDVEHCRVLFGQASVKRMTDEIDGALDDLTRAEELAAEHRLDRDRARIHHLRGNLLFPRGDVDGCLREHRQSLDIARRIGSARLEAQALGGVGDAEYARGRMRTADDLLTQCVELARQTSQGKIEVANLAQIGHTGRYFRPMPDVLRHSLEAIEACRRVGHMRAQLNVTVAAGVAQFHLGHLDEALAHYLRAEELIRELGAYRFLGDCLYSRAQVVQRWGRHAEALELTRESVRLCRESGIAFEGPIALAVLAELTPDPGERSAALAEAEEVMSRGCVAHNQLNFYPIGMAIAIESDDFTLAARYADALEQFTRPEPLASSDWAIRSTRCLLAAGDGRADAAQTDAVQRNARQLGYRLDLSEFESRLARFAGRTEDASR